MTYVPEKASNEYPEDFDPLQLEDAYYKGIGMKCGLEIHQQLITRDKLFCRCRAVMRNGPHDAEILRHMRPTLSELGEYDGTALMEFKTKKNIIYQLFNDIVCTYEMDDTPPFEVNLQAMDIVIELCLLMNCSIVDEIHISRKQYLDGSIPTGFQRTAIVGINGKIPYKGREIGIIQLALEEDACREISDKGHTIIFRTDRLSTPLVEVVTYPHIQTPSESGEVALLLGRLMRCTYKVRRGSGATRQDVNVSVTGGTRVEIKGVGKWQFIPSLVAHEALRQTALLEIRDMAKGRGITKEMLGDKGNVKDVTACLCSTECPVLKKAVERKWRIMAIRLPKMGGLMELNIGPKRRLWKDFEGRVRVIACLDELPNLMILSQMEFYKLKAEELLRAKKEVGWQKGDELVITWGDEKDSAMASKEIILRAMDILIGVPNETRQVMKDGTTDFERILPGADRMYPDTDSPPTKVGQGHLDEIKANLAEPIWNREARLKALGLKDLQAYRLAVSEWLPVFDKAVAETDASPMLMAVIFLETMKNMRRKGDQVRALKDEHIVEMFDMVGGGALVPEAIPPVLEFMARNLGEGPKKAAEALGFVPIGNKELEERIDLAIKMFKGDVTSKNAKDALMGVVMAELRGRVPGRVVSDEVTKAVAKVRSSA